MKRFRVFALQLGTMPCSGCSADDYQGRELEGKLYLSSLPLLRSAVYVERLTGLRGLTFLPSEV